MTNITNIIAQAHHNSMNRTGDRAGCLMNKALCHALYNIKTFYDAGDKQWEMACVSAEMRMTKYIYIYIYIVPVQQIHI